MTVKKDMYMYMKHVLFLKQAYLKRDGPILPLNMQNNAIMQLVQENKKILDYPQPFYEMQLKPTGKISTINYSNEVLEKDP